MLYNAIEDDDLEAVRRLVKRGEDVNAIDFDHEATPLEKAAEESNAEAVSLLLELGAFPNGAMISPALLIAATNGDTEIVRILLDGGAGPNETNEDGVTPLMGAAMKGHKELVEMLLAGGADPRQRARDGDTAHYLAKRDDIRSLLPSDESDGPTTS
jgi:ankyrin repeat protein